MKGGKKEEGKKRGDFLNFMNNDDKSLLWDPEAVQLRV